MAWTNGIAVPALDDAGRIKQSPEAQTNSKSVKFYSGNKDTDGDPLFEAALGTTTEFFWTVPAVLEYIGAIIHFGSVAAYGDTCKLELLSGATVLGNFGTEFGVIPGATLALLEDLTKKDLVANLKLKLSYTSTGGTNVPVVINHKVKQ